MLEIALLILIASDGPDVPAPEPEWPEPEAEQDIYYV